MVARRGRGFCWTKTYLNHSVNLVELSQIQYLHKLDIGLPGIGEVDFFLRFNVDYLK